MKSMADQYLKVLSKYLRLLFEAYQWSIIMWTGYEPIVEYDKYEKYIFISHYQDLIMLDHPNKELYTALKEATELEHKIVYPMELLEQLEDETNVSYLMEHCKKCKEQLIWYLQTANYLLLNLSDEEACKLLNVECLRALLLGMDCKKTITDEIGPKFAICKGSDFKVSSIESGLEVVNHKRFWRKIEYYGKKLGL